MPSVAAVQATPQDEPRYSCGRCFGHISRDDLFYPTEDVRYHQGSKRQVAFHPFIPGAGCVTLRFVTDSTIVALKDRVRGWRVFTQKSSYQVHEMKSIRGLFKTRRKAKAALLGVVSRVEREHGVPA